MEPTKSIEEKNLTIQTHDLNAQEPTETDQAINRDSTTNQPENVSPKNIKIDMISEEQPIDTSLHTNIESIKEPAPEIIPTASSLQSPKKSVILTRAKSKIKKPMITDDTKQRFQIIGGFFAEIFKVLMACLPAIFVPQRCRANDICELSENFSDLTAYNTFVLVWNFITLAGFACMYGFELYRENWCVEKLDINDLEDDYYLNTYVSTKNQDGKSGMDSDNKYSKILNKMYSINTMYNKITKIAIGLLASNFIFSAILVLGMYYYDYRTITTLLSNTLLVTGKVSNGLTISQKSVDKKISISSYLTKYISFNDIDSDYK